MNCSTSQFKKQYKRIPIEKQKNLISLVFKHQWQIKQVASVLDIIYSSAKNVISCYKKATILKKPNIKKNGKRCQYKKLVNQHSRIQIICTNGGFRRSYIMFNT